MNPLNRRPVCSPFEPAHSREELTAARAQQIIFPTALDNLREIQVGSHDQDLERFKELHGRRYK